MFIVTGYHYKQEYMTVEKRLQMYRDQCPAQVDLNDFVQIGQFAINTDSSVTACRKAFDNFNWVDSNLDAPAIVCDLAKFYETHTHMSVGDVIQVTEKIPGGYAHQYFVCMPEGWGPTTTKI